jgi:hypothetical protein
MRLAVRCHRWRVLLNLTPQRHNVFGDRDARRLHHCFEHAFIHPHRRADDARAHVRQIGQFEQPLHRAIFAERAVQQREDHVQFDDG